MNSKFYILIFLAIAVLSACKKDSENIDDNSNNDIVNTQPEITKTYYIRAKFNDEWVLNQTSGEVYCQTNGGICWSNIIDLMDNDVYMGVDNLDVGCCYFTPTKILDLEGDTLFFNSTNIKPIFGWDIDNVYFSSGKEDNQENSYMYIESVEEDGTSYGYDYSTFESFKIKGTFECKINNSDGDSLINVTMGEFSIRVTEEEMY